MTDEELIAEARRVGYLLRRCSGDVDRLAGALLAELAARLCASALTDDDRQVITQARQLAMLPNSEAIAAHTGYESNQLANFVSAFGEAQEVIIGLIAIIAGLDNTQATEAGHG